MVDAVLTPARNVIDFAGYRAVRRTSAVTAPPLRALCRHCGAALGEDESDDDCSSAGIGVALPAPPRRVFRAE